MYSARRIVARIALVVSVMAFVQTTLIAQSRLSNGVPGILSMEERAEVIDRWLSIRFDTVLPEIMRREGIDMWVVIAREYNEDPVIKTMLPSSWISARRRTVLVFFDQGDKLERLAVARYNIGNLIEGQWDPETQPDQWKRLAEIITERNPKRIGLNRSSTFALADGLTATEAKAFEQALPEEQRAKIVSAERLAIAWLETRTPEETASYPTIVRIARTIISEGFSDKVITPGVTTTTDVEWWYRERIRELKLIAWFHPSVAVQRKDTGGRANEFSNRPDASVILPGDLLHVDFGITYLRLNTDTQMHAYVLRPGETEAPSGLREAFSTGNRLQDILTEQFRTGRSGNEILSSALKQAASEGIEATIYTHPIGFHGHGAGPTIGLWDQQGGVPGRGDYPLFPMTAHSIELNAAIEIPEWDNKKIRIMLEEDALFDGETVRYIDPRMERLLLIPR